MWRKHNSVHKISFLTVKTNRNKKKRKHKHKNKNYFFLVKRRNSRCKLKVTGLSGSQRRRKQKHKWDAIFTPLKLAQAIWPPPRIQGLSPSPPTTTEGRERSTGYEVDLVRHKTDMCFCYFLFPCALFRRKHGCRYKEKEKRIALAFMLELARFHDLRYFTCTYAYVRACVASKNKLVFFFFFFFFFFFYASTHARPALIKVSASCYTCASACVASVTWLFTRL